MSRPSTTARPGRMMARLLATVAACAVATVGLVSTPAAAAPTTAAAIAAAPTEGHRAPVMIVLDASGSMNADDVPGSRIDAAKKAVTSLIGTMPADVQVGLQVFGTHTGSSDAEKAAGCRDTVTMQKVGPLNKTAMTRAVGGIKASGYTPIGNALRAAADALPNEGPRSIVLVSDGEDTCAPPEPCDVAKDLKQQGIDLVVHTIGFKVDDIARGQLSCIAAATGGSYADAGDAGELTEKLDTGFQRAAEKYSPKGSPVHGTPKPAGNSPVLAPGQYLDKLEAGPAFQGKKAKYYRVPLTQGMTPWASATAIGRNGSDITGLDVGITWVNQDGADCFHGGYDAKLGANGLAPITTVIADAISYGDKWPQECRGSNTVYLAVWRAGDHAEKTELPVEIIVRQEPPAVTRGLPGPATKSELQQPPVAVAKRAATRGGRDLNSAPALKPGITYTDTITTTENRFYKVRVQWGQQLTVHLVPTKANADALQVANATVHLLNPMRVDLGPFLSEPGKGTGSWGYQKAYPLSASTLYPARYTNRNSKNSEIQRYTLDGYYYLQLAMQQPTYNDKPAFTEPFTITVATPGTVEPGPNYQVPTSSGGTRADQQPRGSDAGTSGAGTAGTEPTVSTGESGSPARSASAEPGTASASTPASISETGSASAPQVEPSGSGSVGAVGSESTADAANASATGDTGMPSWLWGVIAAVVVLGGGALATILRGRRRPQPPGANRPDRWNDDNGRSGPPAH